MGAVTPPFSAKTYGVPFTTADEASIQKLRAAMANYDAGLGDCVIACVGDSTTRGVNGAAGSAAYPNAWPNQMGAMLAAQGYKVARDNLFASGGQASGAALAAADSRVAVTGTWSTSTKTVGGRMLSASAAGSIAFTPTDQVDTFDIYFVQASGKGTFNCNIDGGSNTLVSLNGATAVKKTTLTAGSVGAHTVNLVWASGAIDFMAVVAYNSTRKNVFVLNCGWSGSQTTDWATASGAPWDPLTFLQTFAPAGVWVNLGINDARGISSSTPATFARDMATILNSVTSYASTVIETLGSDGDTATFPTIATYRDPINAQIAAYAKQYGIPIFDLNAAWGGFTNANALGYLNTDKVHPTTKGYAARAKNAFRMLRL